MRYQIYIDPDTWYLAQEAGFVDPEDLRFLLDVVVDKQYLLKELVKQVGEDIVMARGIVQNGAYVQEKDIVSVFPQLAKQFAEIYKTYKTKDDLRSEIDTAFENGEIDEWEYYAQLDSLSYSPCDPVDEYLSSFESAAHDLQLLASIAQILRNVGGIIAPEGQSPEDGYIPISDLPTVIKLHLWGSIYGSL